MSTYLRLRSDVWRGQECGGKRFTADLGPSSAARLTWNMINWEPFERHMRQQQPRHGCIEEKLFAVEMPTNTRQSYKGPGDSVGLVINVRKR